MWVTRWHTKSAYRRSGLLIILALLTINSLASATRPEYRGFWVDTFNSNLNNHADVLSVVQKANSAKANVLFVQVRRRGDAWYLNSLEPQPDFVPIEAGFDPLYDLIQAAHANELEVHAFVIMGAIWNKNPSFAPTATLGPPTSAAHAFNLHSGFDPSTGQVEQGFHNWLTRSLLPDGTAGISFQGHRFGSDFWLDFGHPDAAAYSAEVVLQLVRNYALDGLHLDRIRYPEFSASGQTPTSGANIGYNAVSVYRFQERYGIAHDSPPPDPGDDRWSQWRRDQVTNLVRRIYLNARAIRPKVTISAALIAFGGGPTTEASWKAAEAYWRVFQDWRAWTQEGILDLAIPMNYKRDSIAQQAGWYDQWNEWTRNHQYSRAALAGLGIYLNPIEWSLPQTRRALQASTATGRSLLGVSFYSLAVPDAALNDIQARGIAEFASALTTGKSVDASTRYEDPELNPVPIFADRAAIPELKWKTAPTLGHLMGYAVRGRGAPLDTADVFIYNAKGQVERATTTDGNGFFGAVDLPAGRYALIVELGAERMLSNELTVSPGGVTVATFQ